jgi:hypothetical protein
MRRSPVALLLAVFALSAIPAEAAPPPLKQRAAKLMRFLPKVPAGWSKVEEEVVGKESAMTGKELSVRRRYRKGKAAEEIIEIQIGIQPDGTPLYLASLVDDAAKAAKDKLNGVSYTIGEALGGKAATRTTRNPARGRDEHTVVHKLPNQMMVSYWVWTLPVTAAAPFRKAIDYKKLGAFKP